MMKMGDRLRQAEAKWSENSSPHLQIVIPGSCHAVVKNPPASAGDAGDVGSIPGSGRFSGGGNGNPLQYSCLERIPWTEEPRGLQSIGSQRVRHD